MPCRARFGLCFIALAALFGCAAPEAVCDDSGCISVKKFSAGIQEALDGKVTGYVVLVGAAPTQIHAGGQARTAADAPVLAMSDDLSADVASVSKLLTAIGVLQSLTRNGIGLDDPIGKFLYPDWSHGGNIDAITFRELLTHHSGFRQNCDGSQTDYAALKRQVAAGVLPFDKLYAQYNNCNFAIFREMLPFMEKSPSVDEIASWDDDRRARFSAAFYIESMNRHVFAPLHIPAADCKPGAPGRTMLSYAFPPGSRPGADWGDWTLSCGGGGWSLTAADLLKILVDLAAGDVLLDASQKAQMRGASLGWDNAVRSDCPDPYLCKNGSLRYGDTAVWTYVGIFKCAVPVVAIVNSVLPPAYQPTDAAGNHLANGGDIVGLVRDAYRAAQVSAPMGTPRPPCGGVAAHDAAAPKTREAPPG